MEPEVRQAVLENRWTPAVRSHADACESCGEARAVMAALAAPRPVMPPVATDPRMIWLAARCARRLSVETKVSLILTATQFAARGFIADPAEQASPQDVQLCLTHGSLQAKHQPVVEHRGVVDPIRVTDQSVSQAAEIEQAVPVGVVAGQTRDLQAEHDTDMAQCDLRGEPRKAAAFDNA